MVVNKDVFIMIVATIRGNAVIRGQNCVKANELKLTTPIRALTPHMACILGRKVLSSNRGLKELPVAGGQKVVELTGKSQ